MGPKLYYHPLSTFSRRVRLVFAEKQIPHELSLVDMAARRHREQPYLSLNPYGRVPTLGGTASSCSSPDREALCDS
jgi:glutathione S-transferase